MDGWMAVLRIAYSNKKSVWDQNFGRYCNWCPLKVHFFADSTISIVRGLKTVVHTKFGAYQGKAHLSITNGP